METMYNYLLQSGLCMLLLYLFYLLVLRHFPRHEYNRAFLLLTPPAALLIPVLDFRFPFLGDYTFVKALPVFGLREVTVNAGLPNAEASINSYLALEFILAGLYTLVGFALLIRLGIQLVRLRKLILSSSHEVAYTSGATIIQTSSNYPVFAFLKYVFVSPQPHLTDQEQKQVLAHELAHVRLRHTYDVLYYEILTAILWFNPLVWLLKAELRDVHEYQADAVVINVYQPESYTSLLTKQALFKTGIPVGSYFYRPQIFKRLHMLQQRNRKTDMLRPLLVLPLLLLLLFIFSAEGVTAEKVATTPTTEATAPPVTQKDQQKENPYTYVEQMPVFEGGDAAMQKFVAENIRYPEAAQETKTEGLVVVSFVIEKDGRVTDAQIVKALGNGIDEEALRVINLMDGKWQPGKQHGNAVPVRYTYPFRFQLK